MQRRLFTAFTFTALIAAAFGVGSAQAQTKWDLASAYHPTNFHVENLNRFASEVDKATAGKLKINVHSNASLFKANEIKRAVQGGQAAAGEILLVNYENENPLFGLDGIPFLATSYADAKRLYELQKPALDKLLASQNMKLLFSVPWPPQGIFAKKEIGSVAELRGAKWRAYSPATAKMAELIGAQPVVIQAAELSQALATGTIDTYISSGSTGYDTKTYESLKYWHDNQAWLPKNAVLVNKKAYDALDATTQAALNKSAHDAEVRGWTLSQEKNDWYKKALTDKGMKILAPAAKFTADLKQVGAIMQQDWVKKAGPEGKAIVDAFNSGKK